MTADDVTFAYEDVIRNEELTPVMPTWLLSGEEPATLEKIDGHTVRFTFAGPRGLFQTRLALSSDGSILISKPRHYLQKFHAKYSPDVKNVAKDEGFDSWADLFGARSDFWGNSELPRLHPWKITAALGEGHRVIAERNPYYFKTDPSGRQLPYLDQVVYEVVTDIEVMILKATNGELAFHTRHFNTPKNKPVIARNRDQGGYDFTSLIPYAENDMVIALNLTHEDPAKRAVFQNRDFRVGLSYAINRRELINTAFQRQGLPWQAAPVKRSDYYDEEFATQYTEFDVDKANEHLDRAGYTNRDSEGFRLGPNGKRIFFTVEIPGPTLVDGWVDAMQLVVDYWKKVGIKASIKNEDRSLFYERKAANKHDAGVWIGAASAVFDPRWYFPFSSESFYAVPWAAWFSSRGKTGQRPPEATRRQMKLYWQLMETPDEDARDKLMRQILDIAKSQFYVIGTKVSESGYGIVKNDFHNVPKTTPDSWIYYTPAPTNPEQFFTDNVSHRP